MPSLVYIVPPSRNPQHFLLGSKFADVFFWHYRLSSGILAGSMEWCPPGNESIETESGNGPRAGKKGYGTMPFEYLETLAADFWTIRK